MIKKVVFICCIVILHLSGCTNISTDKSEASFVRTVDGDTLIATIDGTDEYIRLLLVDTPETKHPNKGIQPFGQEASKLMEETFSPGDPIKIEYGTEKRDKYDRILAYVSTDEGQMFNELLLENGLARVAYVFPPNDKYVDSFRKLEKVAKEKEKGIWGIAGYVTKKGFNMDVITQYEREYPFNTNGPDCNFFNQEGAQVFFQIACGPNKDLHRLDVGEGGELLVSI